MTTTTTRKQRYQQRFDAVRDSIDDAPGSFTVAILILTILIALFLKVITLNIAPYLIVMGEAVPPASGIPIVGWIWDVLNLAYFYTGAFIAWGLLLMAETIWILIYFDRKAHRAAIRESQDEQHYQSQAPGNTTPDRITRRMQRRAVRLPFFFIAAAGFIALVGYGIEAVIQFKAYPPIKSWDAFTAGLSIGDLSPVSFDNIIRAAWGMVGTELFVVAIIIVIQWINMHRAGGQP
jgi:hypothetical protein